jgi:hypothetical protein
MVEFGRFGILAYDRSIKLGGRAFDVLVALIDASGAVVSKDELLNRVRQSRIVDENRQSSTTFGSPYKSSPFPTLFVYDSIQTSRTP